MRALDLCGKVILAAALVCNLSKPANCQNEIASFVNADGVPHIVFADQRHHVNDLAYREHQWRSADLTTLSHARNVSPNSGLTEFALADGVPHIVLIDDRQHIEELVYQDRKWNVYDLTASCQGQLVSPYSLLTAFVLSDGTPHIAFVDVNRHIGHLFYQDHRWVFSDLTGVGGQAAAARSGLTSFVLRDRMPHIAFVDQRQHVDQLFYQDGKWLFNDLTAAGKAPASAIGGHLTSFVLSDNVPHIAFVDGHQHIAQLFYQDRKWLFNDLTVASGGSPALPLSGIGQFVLSDGMPHIVLVDNRRHVCALFYQDHRWGFNDLTATRQRPSMLVGNAGLTSYVLHGIVPHVVFMDVGQHVDEFVFENQKWNFDDLTKGSSGN
jgi:hypothetical protein